jgi:hypothetical protein
MRNLACLVLLLVSCLGESACGGGTSPGSPTSPTRPSVNIPAAVSPMLEGLAAEVDYAVRSMQDAIPRNPHLVSLMQAKIALLQSPALRSNIESGQFWAVDTSMAGTPVAAVFPVAEMRGDATTTVAKAASGLEVLSAFMAPERYPASYVRIWYGFMVGSTGGGGVMTLEDRATYEGRLTPTMLPWEPVIYHELGHSYISHEGLNQFLEVYAYNRIHTGSADPARWIWVRAATFTSFQAVLDIYKLIGLDATRSAYRTIFLLRPQYGVLLSEACKKAFVDAAPEALKAQVAALAATITY